MRDRSASWDESPPSPPALEGSLDGRRPAEIEIRDERGEEGPGAWIGSIGAQLDRYAEDRVPFAVLLVEVLEIERLRQQETPEELARLVVALERALAEQLREPGGTLTRERPGRCWLTAPRTDRPGAEALAGRLAAAVASLVGRRGAALEVEIGTAVCPQDGLKAAALAAHADIGLYAARTAARGGASRRATPVDEGD